MGGGKRPALFHLLILSQLVGLPAVLDLSVEKDIPTPHPISRRSVLDIAFVLWCYRNHYQFSIYSVNGYGCYCGKGGDGMPLDDFDTCCFKHDCCYEEALLTSCGQGTNIYLKPSYSVCEVGRAECPEGLEPCSSHLCLCDKQLAECLAITTYQDQHANYQKKLCTEPKLKCPTKEKIEVDTKR
ncbi:basic phospholipase A2 Sms-N6-like [Mobula hypostoma]|uniref:basic phospholipase A2 Sms-N6-like n=1 Tax=Mobula hypostoma TaxID=723540 RepID=UPI002FC35ECF